MPAGRQVAVTRRHLDGARSLVLEVDRAQPLVGVQPPQQGVRGGRKAAASSGPPSAGGRLVQPRRFACLARGCRSCRRGAKAVRYRCRSEGYDCKCCGHRTCSCEGEHLTAECGSGCGTEVVAGSQPCVCFWMSAGVDTLVDQQVGDDEDGGHRQADTEGCQHGQWRVGEGGQDECACGEGCRSHGVALAKRSRPFLAAIGKTADHTTQGERGERVAGGNESGTAAGLGDSGVYAARAAAGVMMVSYSTGVNRARRR